ncbi:hypothetical protein P4J10_23230 [Bacillus cereus]|uniref:hypothetical protein n=1 Tax=Bacillus cereus group TaxID=86661 RepID=UPI000B43ECF9|nr:hypothetical protein [Bacillus thuringiensis]MEB9469509.1 hypothetical protein [Bacillus cereus]MRA82282.1 hypothetical protein [Bacillus thuringiensis]OUA18984.1 hypothetical protein BK776_28100 [Bacillus thuringiensis serovar aizawai]
MELTIKEKVINISYLNAYVVECEAMYGDADGWGEVEVGGFTRGKDEHLLKEFLEFCERMKNAYPNGRGGYDDYGHVEGYDKWFYADNLTTEEFERLPKKVQELSTYWLNDPQGDGMEATFKDYEVFYYDESGIKHNVEVKGIK